MSGYTPGPWTYKNRVGAGLEIYGGRTPNELKRDATEGSTKLERLILQMTQPIHLAFEPWVQFPTNEWDEMQEANARLIAQAPRMAELLLFVCANGLHGDTRDDIMAVLKEAGVL